MSNARHHAARACGIAVVTTLMLGSPASAAAQGPIHGVVYAGAAGVSGFYGSLSGFQAGGGVEWHVANGPVSIAGGMGVLGNAGSVLVATSIDAGYHTDSQGWAAAKGISTS
jgi:hypothetical protein